MKSYDCVIIDSGVNLQHNRLKNHKIYGMSISLLEKNNTVVSEVFQDRVGHGTAIYSIIYRYAPENTKILNINIWGEENHVCEESLIAALQYVYENVKCKVINISLGVKLCVDINQLYTMCKKISERGTLILSAFDNEGAISYPAAFDCVIGVDASDECVKITDFEYIENSVINVRAKGGYQKVFWTNPEYAIGKGSSYSCAYMCAYVLQLLAENPAICLNEIKDIMKKDAKRIYADSSNMLTRENSLFEFANVVIFPMNKEIHAVLAYNSLIPFTIHAITDLRQSGNVGKKVQDIIRYKSLGEIGNKIIGDYDLLDWNGSFDTLLLGHIHALEFASGRELFDSTVKLCIKHHKNLICLDDVSMYTSTLNDLKLAGCKVYSPRCGYNSFSYNQFGKLYRINKPVLCVAGTSSSQGKFSLQLSLREEFIKAGYRVAQLGTEPTSLLFGIDEVFHYGYSVTDSPCFEHTVSYVNYLMHRIELKDPDIIIAGSQSGLVPYIYDNLAYLTHRQMEVLAGIMPDAVILCINPQDDVEFIERTIQSVESFINTSVLCCSIYPMKYSEKFMLYNKKEEVGPEELIQIANSFSKKLEKPVFPMNVEGVKKIYELIVDYFSE